MFGRFLRGHARPARAAARRLRFAIVGAGATGVEFAAELRHAARQLVGYGLRGFDPDRDVEVRLIEAAPSVLPALPERLQEATERAAARRSASRSTPASRSTRVTAEGVHTRSGRPDARRPDRVDRGRQGRGLARRARRPRGQPAQPAGGRSDPQGHAATSTSSRSATAPPARSPAAIARCRRAPRRRTSRRICWPGRSPAGSRASRSLPFVYKDYGSLISLSSSTHRQSDGQSVQEHHDRGTPRAPRLSVAVQEAPGLRCTACAR